MFSLISLLGGGESFLYSGGTPSPGFGAARGFGGFFLRGSPAASRGPSPLGAAQPIVVGFGWKFRSWGLHLRVKKCCDFLRAQEAFSGTTSPRVRPHSVFCILVYVHVTLLWSRRRGLVWVIHILWMFKADSTLVKHWVTVRTSHWTMCYDGETL